MPCSDWLTKGPICLLCLISLLCSDLEGRSYEQCSAEDGRRGYCVAIIYCRQGQSQRLLRCQGNNDNYCCPLPTPQTSATEKPKRHIVERPRRPTDDENLFGHEDRSRPSGSRYDPQLDGNNGRHRRPTPGRTELGGDDRMPSRPRYDPDLDGKPTDERPRRPPDDRTASSDEDRRPSRPRYDPELDGKPVDERPRRPPHDRTALGGEDRSRPSGSRYNPDLNGKPIDERPRRPPDDRTMSGDEARSRPSSPKHDPELESNERPRRPTNDRTFLDDEDRRSSRPRYDPDLDGRPIDERPRRPLNNRGDEDRRRPSGPRYDPELDGKPVDESPRIFNGGPYEDRSEPSRPRYDTDPDDSPGPRGPDQPYRPGESNDFNRGQSRPLRPTRPDEGNTHRPKDRTGPSDQGSRGPVIRFPDRQSDRRNNDGGRRDVPGSRRDDDSKVSDGRRVDEDRPRGRPENPRKDDRPPPRGAGDAPKSNATTNRAPDGRAPQLPKIPGCGVQPYKLFIAGGEVSEDHQWPWMAAIFRRFPDSRPKAFLCGGSLINTRFVLTAAHCFVNNHVILPASSFVVRLGSNYLNSGEEYTVAKLVVHHNHSGSDYFNDIALIRLAGEVLVTDKIAPICLPTHQMALVDMVGLRATVAGWGDVEYRTSGTRLLQHVTIPIVSNQACSSAYSRVRGAAFLARGSDHVICAGLKEGGKDACLGDSGGPLMMEINEDQWVVIGVVSLGYKCAEPGYYGVYTRVTHYTPWIDGHLRQRH